MKSFVPKPIPKARCPCFTGHSRESPHIALYSALRNGHPQAHSCVVLLIVGIFVYFLFFRILADVIHIEKGLKDTMPMAQSAESKTFFDNRASAKLSISIAADGSVSFNGESVSGDLSVYLKSFADKNLNNQIRITVSADEKAPYDRIIDVLNSIAVAGLKEGVTFELSSGTK